MESVYWIDYFPIPFLFVLTVLMVFGAIMLGRALGAWMKEKTGGSESIGSVVGATLGFLAFLLAFTFNMSANRYESRKTMLMDELNAINTAYHRAGLLSEPDAHEIRGLLMEYIDLRVGMARDPGMVLEVVKKSEKILNTLWMDMEELSVDNPLLIKHSLYVQSLNDLMSLLEKRVIVGLHYGIPGAIWFGLYILAFMGMVLVGYQFGQSKNRQWLVSLVLSLAFSSIIVLIVDLDRPLEGAITLNQHALFDFQQKIEAFL